MTEIRLKVLSVVPEDYEGMTNPIDFTIDFEPYRVIVPYREFRGWKTPRHSEQDILGARGWVIEHLGLHERRDGYHVYSKADIKSRLELYSAIPEQVCGLWISYTHISKLSRFIDLWNWGRRALPEDFDKAIIERNFKLMTRLGLVDYDHPYFLDISKKANYLVTKSILNQNKQNNDKQGVIRPCMYSIRYA